jgi:hypothetical protein
MFPTTCPAALVRLLILAQIRELAERATIVGATLAMGAFLSGEAGCETGWASIELCRTQANNSENPNIFIKMPLEKKPPREMKPAGYIPRASLESPHGAAGTSSPK